MSIDPTTLSDAALVETTADHFAEGQTYLTKMIDVRHRGDLTVLRVLLPIPDGVSLDAAVKALADITPVDPDAEWIEQIAEVLHGRDEGSDGHPWKGCPGPEKFRKEARVVLDVARAVGL